MPYENNLSLVKEAVHSPLNYDDYNSTVVKNNTNCLSHAIGSTIPCLSLYRIGAISNTKPIEQQYFSIEEILYLLIQDFIKLNLKIEKSFLGDNLMKNQYQIALFVIIYANGLIHDFHFLRNDKLGWSEKRRYYAPIILPKFDKRNYFPWNFVDIFRVTK